MGIYAGYHTAQGDFDQGDSDAVYCDVCGNDMEWETCWACFGEGEFDLYDEDPLYYDEGDTEECTECNGDGGYWVCTALPHEEAA